MPVDRIELVSETTGKPPMRANTVNAAAIRVDKDNGDLVYRDQNGTKRRIQRTEPAGFFLPGATPQTAANWGVFFTAPFKCIVTAVVERHETAGNDAGAVTVMIKKVPSGTAKAAGTDLLSAGINLKAAADTNQAGSLVASSTTLTLAAGDSLAAVLTGTPTTLAGVSIVVSVEKTT